MGEVVGPPTKAHSRWLSHVKNSFWYQRSRVEVTSVGISLSFTLENPIHGPKFQSLGVLAPKIWENITHIPKRHILARYDAFFTIFKMANLCHLEFNMSNNNGSLKSPCSPMTSYRSSIETITLNCLFLWENHIFMYAFWRQTDRQKDVQPRRTKTVSLSQAAT